MSDGNAPVEGEFKTMDSSGNWVPWAGPNGSGTEAHNRSLKERIKVPRFKQEASHSQESDPNQTAEERKRFVKLREVAGRSTIRTKLRDAVSAANIRERLSRELRQQKPSAEQTATQEASEAQQSRSRLNEFLRINKAKHFFSEAKVWGQYAKASVLDKAEEVGITDALKNVHTDAKGYAEEANVTAEYTTARIGDRLDKIDVKAAGSQAKIIAKNVPAIIADRVGELEIGEKMQRALSVSKEKAKGAWEHERTQQARQWAKDHADVLMDIGLDVLLNSEYVWKQTKWGEMVETGAKAIKTIKRLRKVYTGSRKAWRKTKAIGSAALSAPLTAATGVADRLQQVAMTDVGLKAGEKFHQGQEAVIRGVASGVGKAMEVMPESKKGRAAMFGVIGLPLAYLGMKHAGVFDQLSQHHHAMGTGTPDTQGVTIPTPKATVRPEVATATHPGATPVSPESTPLPTAHPATPEPTVVHHPTVEPTHVPGQHPTPEPTTIPGGSPKPPTHPGVVPGGNGETAVVDVSGLPKHEQQVLHQLQEGIQIKQGDTISGLVDKLLTQYPDAHSYAAHNGYSSKSEIISGMISDIMRAHGQHPDLVYTGQTFSLHNSGMSSEQQHQFVKLLAEAMKTRSAEEYVTTVMPKFQEFLRT